MNPIMQACNAIYMVPLLIFLGDYILYLKKTGKKYIYVYIYIFFFVYLNIYLCQYRSHSL